MDPVTLSATIVGSFLVPLFKGGANALGDALAQTSRQLWERVASQFAGPTERKALELFERDPEKLRELVDAMLRERLQADEQLRSELDGIVGEATQRGASTGAQITGADNAVVIDNRESRISGGTF